MNEGCSYGSRVRYWRKRAGLTKAELAKLVGVSEPAVYHWESDRYPPTLAHVNAVAEACGVDLRMFFSPIPRDEVAA